MRSDDGLRLARFAERRGWRFPRFSPDEVVQMCVEEALMARCAQIDTRAAEEQSNRDAVAAAEVRAASAVERMRHGG